MAYHAQPRQAHLESPSPPTPLPLPPGSEGSSSSIKLQKPLRLPRAAIDLFREQGNPVFGPYQVVYPRAAAPPNTKIPDECYTGNENLSCYPTTDTQVVQDTWSKFIWNKGEPSLTNNGGFVDVYLYRQDSDHLVTSFTSLPNSQGRVAFRPQDSWWQGEPAADGLPAGQNRTWPFYFVVQPAGKKAAEGSPSRLATWHAVQTARPADVVAKEAAANASSASAAAMGKTTTSLPSASPTINTTANGNLNHPAAHGLRPLPHWAVALVSVFVLLFVAMLIMLVNFLAGMTDKKKKHHPRGASTSSSRSRSAARGMTTTTTTTTSSGRATRFTNTTTTVTSQLNNTGATTTTLTEGGSNPFPSSSSPPPHGPAPVTMPALDPPPPFPANDASRVAQAFHNTLRQPPIAAARFSLRQSVASSLAPSVHQHTPSPASSQRSSSLPPPLGVRVTEKQRQEQPEGRAAGEQLRDELPTEARSSQHVAQRGRGGHPEKHAEHAVGNGRGDSEESADDYGEDSIGWVDEERMEVIRTSDVV